MNAIVLAIALATAIVQPAADAPLTGEWKVRNDISGNVSDMTCTFTQKGSELTGGCDSPQGPVEIAGKVEDKSVTWAFKSVYEGNPITVAYKGALGVDGTVAGAVTVEEFSASGEFTATPVKK